MVVFQRLLFGRVVYIVHWLAKKLIYIQKIFFFVCVLYSQKEETNRMELNPLVWIVCWSRMLTKTVDSCRWHWILLENCVQHVHMNVFVRMSVCDTSNMRKKNRCENKAALIHTSMIIVIENKCDMYRICYFFMWFSLDFERFYIVLCTFAHPPRTQEIKFKLNHF